MGQNFSTLKPPIVQVAPLKVLDLNTFLILFDYLSVYYFLILVVDRAYLLLRLTMTAILISLRFHHELYFSDMLTLSTLITLFSL